MKVYKFVLKFKLDELQRIKQNKRQSSKTGSSIGQSNIENTKRNQDAKNFKYFESSSFNSNQTDQTNNQKMDTIILKSNLLKI